MESSPRWRPRRRSRHRSSRPCPIPLTRHRYGQRRRIQPTSTILEPSRPMPTLARHRGTRRCLIPRTRRRYGQRRETQPTSSIPESTLLHMPTPASPLLLGGDPRWRMEKAHTVIAEDTTKSDTPRRLADDLMTIKNTTITRIKPIFASLTHTIFTMRITFLTVTIRISGTIYNRGSPSTPAAFPRTPSFPA